MSLIAIIDPPYGINIVKNGKIGKANRCKQGNYENIINDNSTETAKNAYKTLLSCGIEKFIIFGGNYFTDFLKPSPSWIIWDKKGDMNSNNFADCELAWTSFNKPARIITHLWRGMIKQGENTKRVHPTQKPIGLLSQIIKEYTKKDDVIIDTFLGSGTTLIACEKTNRRFLGMELSENYCQVIIDRYINFKQNKGEDVFLLKDGKKIPYKEIVGSKTKPLIK